MVKMLHYYFYYLFAFNTWRRRRLRLRKASPSRERVWPGVGGKGMGNGAGNVIQSQSGCRLLCILSRSTCMLPDASQDPTIRHILNDVAVAVAVVSVNVPSRPKLLCLSLGRLHVALIEKFASQSRAKAEKRKQIKREKWKKNFFGHLSFDDFRLASIGSGWAGLVCPLFYPPDGPVLALVLSAAPSWLCRLCLCKKFVYCLLSRALPGRWEEGEDLSSSMAVLLLLFLELK